jgi:hypothetical protein
MLTPFALSARLVLSLENDDFLVNAADDKIVVDLPSWRAGLAVMRCQSARGGWSQLLTKVQRGLTVADLQMQFRLAGKIVARLGTDTRPGIVSRLLGLGPLELRPLQLLRSMWSRPRPISSQ